LAIFESELISSDEVKMVLPVVVEQPKLEEESKSGDMPPKIKINDISMTEEDE